MHAFPVPAVLACATSAWLPYLVWQPAEAQLQLISCQNMVEIQTQPIKPFFGIQLDFQSPVKFLK